MADAQTQPSPAGLEPPHRPEYLRAVVAGSDIGVVQKPLTIWQRLVNQAWLRKAFISFSRVISCPANAGPNEKGRRCPTPCSCQVFGRLESTFN